MNITATYDEAMVKAMIAEAVAKERNSWPAEMEAMERQVNILTDALAQSRNATLAEQPAQRTWVGLTEEEINNSYLFWVVDQQDVIGFGKSLETKFKRKNT